MKQLILKVQDKTKVPRIQAFCQILYVSKYMNTIGIEIQEDQIYKLDEDANVLNYRESTEGTYQSV